MERRERNPSLRVESWVGVELCVCTLPHAPCIGESRVFWKVDHSSSFLSGTTDGVT